MKFSRKKDPRVILIVISLSLMFLFSGCDSESVKVLFDKYEEQGGDFKALKTVAVLGFSTKDEDYGEEISSLVADRLRGIGYMKVMDYEEAGKILREKGLPTGGDIGSEDAKEIAEALGVDALVFGDGKAKFSSYISYRTVYYNSGYDYHKHGKRSYHRPYYRQPYLHRGGYVDINLHFFDGLKGIEIGKIKLKKTYNRDYNTYYSSRVRFNDYYYFDRIKSMPMPSGSEMIMLMTEKILDKMMEKFIPEYISRVRTVEQGVAGSDKAAEGKWNDAKKEWEASLNGSPDEWKYRKNLGIYYERQGNPARALTYYQEALRLDPENADLKVYVEQTEEAKKAKLARQPIDIEKDTIKHKIADVKDDGRVYITAGKEDGISVGDKFIVARPRVEFRSDLVTPKKLRYYPLGTLTIDQTFDGVSVGKMEYNAGSDKVKIDDAVIPE